MVNCIYYRYKKKLETIIGGLSRQYFSCVISNDNLTFYTHFYLLRIFSNLWVRIIPFEEICDYVHI